MSALVIDRANAEISNTSGSSTVCRATPDTHDLSQPKFAAAVRVLVRAYIVAIFVLAVLRGIDGALHG